jgi:hypothetical protein
MAITQEYTTNGFRDLLDDTVYTAAIPCHAVFPKYFPRQLIGAVLGKDGVYMNQITEESGALFIWLHGADAPIDCQIPSMGHYFEVQAFEEDIVSTTQRVTQLLIERVEKVFDQHLNKMQEYENILIERREKINRMSEEDWYNNSATRREFATINKKLRQFHLNSTVSGA